MAAMARAIDSTIAVQIFDNIFSEISEEKSKKNPTFSHPAQIGKPASMLNVRSNEYIRTSTMYILAATAVLQPTTKVQSIRARLRNLQ